MDNLTNNKPPSFNWAILIGFCVMTLGIIWAGGRIADSLPHGFFSTPFQPTPIIQQDSDFLSDWQVASLLMIDINQLLEILESGELDGTFTTFQVYRIWETPYPSWDYSNRAEAPPPPLVHNYARVDHRIFSRERLLGWLNSRIDGN
ncbi:MAG: hypothetical protein FWD97_04315 [Defluviitaleaceae bacterium]|nr:hypothetical protein [Defluviitaleaceae bacterium]